MGNRAHHVAATQVSDVAVQQASAYGIFETGSPDQAAAPDSVIETPPDFCRLTLARKVLGPSADGPAHAPVSRAKPQPPRSRSRAPSRPRVAPIRGCAALHGRRGGAAGRRGADRSL